MTTHSWWVFASSAAGMMFLFVRPARRLWQQRLQMLRPLARPASNRGPGPVLFSGMIPKTSGAVTGDEGIADVPLMLELLATSFDAGLPMVRALEVLAGIATEGTRRRLDVVVAGLSIGAAWQASWDPVRGYRVLESLYAALTFAALTGAPSSALLYAEAAQLRRVRHRNAERRAAALGVKLVMPLGLCFLPAFVCLGIVPVVLAMVPSFR